MRNRLRLSARIPGSPVSYASALSASVLTLGLFAVGPALAVKKAPYPEVKVNIAEAFQADAPFNALRQAFSAAVAAKNADALFALLGPTFVWTFEGGPTDEFDMGRGPLDNFKVVFGFRAVGKDTDGGVEGGPFWDGLSGFAADGTFYKVPNAGNLVCGPVSADVANDKNFEAARKKIETDEEPAVWYFTLADTTVTAAPDDKGVSVAKVGKVALPVLAVHPPEEGAKPTHFEVLLPSGKSGWIPAAAARPLVSNRLCYARTPAGEWKIAAFDQNED
jgi:hypothetical protein